MRILQGFASSNKFRCRKRKLDNLGKENGTTLALYYKLEICEIGCEATRAFREMGLDY